MKSPIVSLVAAVLVSSVVSSSGAAASKQPIIDVRQATIVAFFPPVTQSELSNGDTNEALADFQYYAKQVREPLRKAGIEFQEVYAHSFQIRLGSKTTVFRPIKEDVGYYFVAPGKKPRLEYGVMTDHDLLEIAHEYFGIASR
jgi:hypothetical protein